MWKLYDSLIDAIPEEIKVADFLCGNSWTMIRTDKGGIGLATTAKEVTRKPLLDRQIKGLPLKEVAEAAKSWNMLEASIGVAAINAYYNAAKRAIRLGIAIQNGSILTVKLSRYSKTKSKGKSCFGGAFPSGCTSFGATVTCLC